MILKPSEKDPGATMILAKLCVEAGLPSGVLQVKWGNIIFYATFLLFLQCLKRYCFSYYSTFKQKGFSRRSERCFSYYLEDL